MEKKKREAKTFFQAVFLLSGTIIGAGIFALPFAFSSSGFWLSLLGLAALALVTLAINLFYGKIIINTPGDHQLPGYAGRYLGQKYRILSIICLFLSALGAMFAYIILGGSFLSLLLNSSAKTLLSLLFWSWGAFLIWGGIKTVVLVEGWLTLFLITVCFLLPLLGLPFFESENLSQGNISSFAFYGPLLFALSGLGVIPEVEEVLRARPSLLPKAIAWGVFIPVFVYFVFGFGIWGISGPVTTADALSGLLFFSPKLVRMGALVGVLATFTSFLSLGNVLREMFYRDLNLSFKKACFWAVLAPLPAVFLSLPCFLPIISLTGSVAIGAASILVLLIFLKKFALGFSQKLLSGLLAFLLLGGIIINLL